MKVLLATAGAIVAAHAPTAAAHSGCHSDTCLERVARNGVHAGLFQFRVAAPSTWATTPYAGRDPFSAKWNSLAAAWMHSVGRGGEWACR